MSNTPIIGMGDAANANAKSSDWIKDTTTATFAKDVLDASKQALVLVDFWAPWCGPCRQLTPVLEKVVKASKGRVRLVKMDIDKHPEVAGQLRVQSIPAVFAFKDGRPLDGFMGALPESQVKSFIDKLLGPDEDAGMAEVLASAEEALAAGDMESATEIFSAILEEEPDNVEALAGLVRCYIGAGNFDQAEAMLAKVAPETASNPLIIAAKATLELARKAPAGAERSALEGRVTADPNDHQARYDLALALNVAGDKSGAVEHLFEIMRRNRAWNEDGARKQLVQFFDAWGGKDPATIEGRRQLSIILFS